MCEHLREVEEQLRAEGVLGGGTQMAPGDELWELEMSQFDPSDPECPDATERHVPADVLKEMEPDAGLAAVVQDIAVEDVDEYMAVELVAAFKRLEAWAAGRAARVAAQLAGRATMNPRWRAAGEDRELNVAGEELAMRLGITRSEACRTIEVGQAAFTGTLDEVGRALTAGRLDWRKASTIVRTLGRYPDAVAWYAADEVIDGAGLRTHNQLVRDLSKAVIAVDPHEAEHRRKRAAAGRHVNRMRPLPDGMGALYAVMPCEELAPLDLSLDAAAHAAKAAGDPRTIDQLRADALAAMGAVALSTGWIGTPPGGPVVARVGCCCGNCATGEATSRDVSGGQPTGAHVADHSKGERDAQADPASTAGTGHAGVNAGENGNAGAGDEEVPGVTTSAGTLTAGEAAGDAARDTDEPAHQQSREAGAPAPEETAGVQEEHAVDGERGGGRVTERRFMVGSPIDRTDRIPAEEAPMPPLEEVPSGPDRPPMRLATGARAQINVTVPLSVLVPPEGADEVGPPPEDQEPPVPGAGLVPDEPIAEVAMLQGYGPVTPEVARALALGGVWRRLVTDPASGAVLDVGRSRYRPPEALARHIRHRDRTCIRPACTVPASQCDLDHTIAWSLGGRTSDENLGPACTRDHQVKSSGAFRVTQLSPGVFEWRTASGHTYRRNLDGSVHHLGRATHTSPYPF